MATRTGTVPPTKKRPDPGRELRGAEQRLAKARDARQRIDDEYREWEAQIRAAQAELNHLARTGPAQFKTGRPSPKSRAAALEKKIAQANATKWDEIIAGADDRLAVAEGEVRALLDRHSEQLAEIEFRGGEDDLDRLASAVEEILDVINTLRAREARLIEIANATKGRTLNGQDVYWDQRLDQLRALLDQHRDLKPPRSVHLTPLVGEEPRFMRTPDGGWIEHWERLENVGEQPKPVDPRR